MSDRLDNSLRATSEGQAGALGKTIVTLWVLLEGLSAMPKADFESALDALRQAKRIRVSSIGPSGDIAGCFAAQLARMGADAMALRHTGL